MSYPLQPIDDAKKEIEVRQKNRAGSELHFRNSAALELIADELTLVRAEMEVLRGLLAKFAQDVTDKN
jgi:hypothetical protein